MSTRSRLRRQLRRRELRQRPPRPLTAPVRPQPDAAQCYLCGNALGILERVDPDHVPPRQVFPSRIRRERGLQLLTLPVHRRCHGVSGRDEEYFLQHVLFPLALDTAVGEVAVDDFKAFIKRDAGWNKAQRVAKEYQERPSGLVLPNEQIVKSYAVAPVARTIWKIARGLFFHETGRFLPEDTRRDIAAFVARETTLPELTIALMGEPSRGHSPDVFDYKMRLRDEPRTPHFVLMRFWERLCWQVAFHDPDDSSAATES